MTRRPIPVFPFPPCARPECRERAGRAEPPTMPRLPAAYAYSAPNGGSPVRAGCGGSEAPSTVGGSSAR